MIHSESVNLSSIRKKKYTLKKHPMHTRQNLTMFCCCGQLIRNIIHQFNRCITSSTSLDDLQRKEVSAKQTFNTTMMELTHNANAKALADAIQAAEHAQQHIVCLEDQIRFYQTNLLPGRPNR